MKNLLFIPLPTILKDSSIIRRQLYVFYQSIVSFRMQRSEMKNLLFITPSRTFKRLFHHQKTVACFLIKHSVIQNAAQRNEESPFDNIPSYNSFLSYINCSSTRIP
ncbi:hypothetical protein [Chryseobacterium sp. CT-SW4]|uniref:hypothetical protein n=1 Tax=Chryseobacterium sp. SW-1 TaxID=3157343 RepID=UPI003B021548